MTTENVAILFTDIVGSTELSQRVSAEVADELRRAHFAILREAIAETDGVEVKNLGDGLMAVFNSASAALACSVAMQQGVERGNHDGAESMGLRVGISVGEASKEDDDYFGDPVIEAARLCARCDSGQILATDFVRAMAGRRGRHECRSIGELTLKGLPDPIETVEVVWEPLAGADDIAVPLPGRIASTVSMTFVGRGTERDVLGGSLKAVADGAQQTVLISGEPGIGKTSLSSGFARDAFEDGAIVLYGRCDEDLGIPYQPWSEAISHLVTHLPETLLADHVAARGGELARLVPDLANRVPVPPSSSSDGASERYLLFGAVVDLLARVSATAPVVLLLDDLHWSDRQTVQLFRHVVSADVPLRLLVLGTFRESDVGTDHPLAEALAALHRVPAVVRLALRGLGDDELLALLETTAGHQMTESGLALRDTLMAETEGNPFFVGEMLRHLAETGAIFQDDQGRWTVSADLRTSGLPVSIREVVGRRVARLGEGTQRVLSMASVIGRDFDTDVLAQVADLDEDLVIDLCDQAVTAAVLTEAPTPGRYTFAHALVERALYDSLSSGRRVRAHRRVADALEGLYGEDPGERIGELAYHWAQAIQPQEVEKAMTYAQRAGDRALAQLAPDESVRWYRGALDLLDQMSTDDPPRRAALLFGLGDAQRQTGDPEYRETLLDSARLANEIGDTDLMVRAALCNGRGLTASRIGVVDDERVDVLQQALERLGDVDSPDRARLLALLCVERTYDGDADQRLTLATQAVDMARRTGDPTVLVDAIGLCHQAIAFPRTLELRREWCAEACAIAETLGDPAGRFLANQMRVFSSLEAADLATVAASLSILISEAERIGQPLCQWQVSLSWVWLRLIEGDLGAGEEAANDALTLGTAAGQPDAFAYYGAQLCDVRFKQGRIHELIPLIQQAAEDNPGLSSFRAALVWSKCFGDPDDEVTQLLDLEVAADFPVSGDSHGLLTSHALWAEAAARSGHLPAAARLREILLPWHSRFATTHITLTGSVAHFLGRLCHVLDRYDEADQWFAEALACHEGMQAPYFVAYTQIAWASLLADRDQPGDVQRVRTLIDLALPVASRGGYGYVERDAGNLLRKLG